MANTKQLRILKKGTQTWNDWRASQGGSRNLIDGRPDLSGVDLSGVNLQGANFQGVDFAGTRFVDADLSNTNLKIACLTSADFTNANLTNADLERADLTSASIEGANFDNANLTRAILKKVHMTGVNFWEANLSEADLQEAEAYGPSIFSFANLSGANLHSTCLINCDISKAQLKTACLVAANLQGASFWFSNLEEADLTRANLSGADLRRANLVRANLTEANLEESVLIATKLDHSVLTACRIYGLSAWNVSLIGASQKNLIITPEHQPTVQVDRLDLGQFVYLLLSNSEIRHVIDTITSKIVLILGRFTEPRKALLDGLREALRGHDYVPILFDFEKPSNQTTMETITTLAGMARFLVVDLTDAKSILQELSRIVPERPSLPVQPLLLNDQDEPGMIDYFQQFHWFLPTVFYRNQAELLESLKEKVILPPETKLRAIRTAAALPD